MSEDEKLNQALENIKPLLGQEHDYFVLEKNRINIELEKISKPEEKLEFLLNEYQVALDTLKVLKERNEKAFSVIDRLNSFSPGLLAGDELVNFIKTQINAVKGLSSLSEEDNDAPSGLNGKAALDLTEQLLLISYLQDGGNFIKRKPHQTEKNIQDLVGLLLKKDYESLKSKVQVINEIKSGRITKGQARYKIENLEKIKDIFLTIGDKTTFDKIENRIRELEKIAVS
jgi:hypothetical protein